MNSPLLTAESLSKSYPLRKRHPFRPRQRFQAVKSVSFELSHGETLGIVGETGAGKSTVGRLALRLIEADSGVIRFDGADLRALSAKRLRAVRPRMQMIFQDPYSSLDPRVTIRDTIGEPLLVHSNLHGAEREHRVIQLLERVGMRADHLDRYPREFSGGQLQRVAIARALATDPEFIVCDEPVAALDVSIQAQVLNLLLDLQSERGLSYLFISHDLSLVRFLAHRVLVMRHGEVVEHGPTAQIFARPEHPYTRELLAAIPHPVPTRQSRWPRRGTADTSLPAPAAPAHIETS